MRVAIIFIAFLFLLLPFKSHTQAEVYKQKNLVKINLLSRTFFNATTLNYERALKPNMSVALGFGLKHKGSVPSFLRQENFNLSLDETEFTGYFYNIEARWYLNRCEGAPSMEGFYIGPYFKFNRYSLDFDMSYDDGQIMEENTGTAKLGEYGLGVFLGYQLRVWKRFMVDFLFFGPRTSRYSLKFNFEEPLSDEFIEAVTDNINETLDRFLMKSGVDPEVTAQEIKSSFSWLSFRYGISIGYTF